MCGYQLVGEESDFSKLNPFLEPKATAGGVGGDFLGGGGVPSKGWRDEENPRREFGEIIEILDMS